MLLCWTVAFLCYKYNASDLFPYEEAFQCTASRSLPRERDGLVIHRLCIHVLRSIFLRGGNLIDLANLPESQEPHAHCRRDKHEACEDLGVKVNISAFLPELEGYWLSDYSKLAKHQKRATAGTIMLLTSCRKD